MRPALVLVALLGSAVPALAQAPAGSAPPVVATPPAVATPPTVPDAAASRRAQGRELMAACRTDIRAWCSKVEPGGGRIIQCFRQNADKLTPACVATLKALRGGGGGSAPSAG